MIRTRWLSRLIGGGHKSICGQAKRKGTHLTIYYPNNAYYRQTCTMCNARHCSYIADGKGNKRSGTYVKTRGTENGN